MSEPQRWDHLLLDCRLATMQENGAPYGGIVDAALGWKNGEIVFAGPLSSLPDRPDALDRKSVV